MKKLPALNIKEVRTQMLEDGYPVDELDAQLGLKKLRKGDDDKRIGSKMKSKQEKSGYGKT